MGGIGGPVATAVGGPGQQYALKWNDFHASILSSFRHLRDEEDFIDVTIACDGCSFTAHKVVLSACSPYFRSLLKANPCQHPIVILRDVREQDMEALLRFMYNGEVHISHEQLQDFLKTAQSLQVRGLAEVTNKEKLSASNSIPWTTTSSENRRHHHHHNNHHHHHNNNNHHHLNYNSGSNNKNTSSSSINNCLKDNINDPNNSNNDNNNSDGEEADVDGNMSMEGQPPSKKTRTLAEGENLARFSESSPSNNHNMTVDDDEQSESKRNLESLSLTHGGGEEIQSISNLHQMKSISERSSQIHSSNEDSNSFDEEGSDADCTDIRPNSATDLAIHPKLETSDYHHLDRSRSTDPTSAALYDPQRQRNNSYPGGLFNIQGLTGGLLPGPSGMHSNQDSFGMLRRSSESAKVRATDPRPCPQCGKIYRSAHTLRTHLEDKHTVCPGYRCVLCGTVAKSRNSLHSHMSRQHRGISTKDLPVLPMPSPFDPELAAKLYSRAGVNISPAELRARASPTGTITPLRRSDFEKNGSGDDDPQDLSINSNNKYNSIPREHNPLPSPLDFHMNSSSAHGFPKFGTSVFPLPLSDKDNRNLPVGSAVLDAYFRLLADNNYVTAEQAAEMAASAKIAAQKEWINDPYGVAHENECSTSQDEDSLSEEEPEPIKAE